MNEQKNRDTRIHPLVAGAAASVILVSVLGVAAITGVLPNSYGNGGATGNQQAQWAPVQTQVQPVSYVDQRADCAYAPVTDSRNAAPVMRRSQRTVERAPSSTHHPRVVRTTQSSSGDYAYENRRYREGPAPVPAAAPRYSPVGIATGAVVGGLLGNQVGGGNGKTLATVAGAVGGGYLGNMAGQRYGY